MSDTETNFTVRRAVKEKMKSDSRENSGSRKKQRTNSNTDSKPSKSIPRKPLVLETDPVVLQRRQKQIDYGKNTVGYHNYLQKVPIDKRTKEQPRTPDKYLKYSRRSWDTLIQMWRKKLHEFDDDSNNVNADNDSNNDDNAQESDDSAE